MTKMNWSEAGRRDAASRADTTNHRLERYAERWLEKREAILCEEATVGRRLTKREKATVKPGAWFHQRRHELDTMDPRDRMKQKPPTQNKASKKKTRKKAKGATR